jgi:hypothetical protein
MAKDDHVDDTVPHREAYALDRIAEEALALPASERAELIERLKCSLAEGGALRANPTEGAKTILPPRPASGPGEEPEEEPEEIGDDALGPIASW